MRPAKIRARGRPWAYSDLAIETTLFIRQIFHLPLRPTNGFMNSLLLKLPSDVFILVTVTNLLWSTTEPHGRRVFQVLFTKSEHSDD